MAYRDYIHCADCDVKLIYDGEDSIRDILEIRYGSDYKLLCPVCIDARAEQATDRTKSMRETLEYFKHIHAPSNPSMTTHEAEESYLAQLEDIRRRARAALAAEAERDEA
jgi:hypothetical protein